MKKFFKNPLNIALLSIVGACIISISLSYVWKEFATIGVFLVGVLCGYSAWLLYHNRKDKQEVDIEDFFPDMSLEERKKIIRAQKSQKFSNLMPIYALLFLSAFFIYYAFTLIK